MSTNEPHLMDYETDHEGIAVGHLLRQFQDKPRIVAFVRAVARAVQCVEDEQWALIEASLIGEQTPLDLLRRWAALIGERSPGSLTRPQLLQIVRARLVANTIGKADRKLNTTGYLDLLVQAFAPSQVRATFNPAGGAGVLIEVISGPGATFLPEALAERAVRIVTDARPIGLLVRIVEGVEDGFAFAGSPDGLGFNEGVWGKRLFNGFLE